MTSDTTGGTFTVTKGTTCHPRRYNYRVDAPATSRTANGSCIVNVTKIRADGEVALTGHGWRYFHFSDPIDAGGHT